MLVCWLVALSSISFTLLLSFYAISITYTYYHIRAIYNTFTRCYELTSTPTNYCNHYCYRITMYYFGSNTKFFGDRNCKFVRYIPYDHFMISFLKLNHLSVYNRKFMKTVQKSENWERVFQCFRIFELCDSFYATYPKYHHLTGYANSRFLMQVIIIA